MPRILPALLIRAARESKYLPALLRESRDLSSARNELRWLTEHAAETCRSQATKCGPAQGMSRVLSSFVNRRNKGEPLQYILGTQPFGDLEILCRKNVLIPRPETELYTTKVAECLHRIHLSQPLPGRRGLRILDLCSGSGCISLLLHQLLRSSGDPRPGTGSQVAPLQVVGLDVSPAAINLANENKAFGIRQGFLSVDACEEVHFCSADVLALSDPDTLTQSSFPATSLNVVTSPPWRQDGSWDVVISNPPYISESDFALGGSTARSVRDFEPKLALVPPKDPNDADGHGDIFYHHIVRIACALDARLVVMEVGDSSQANRVCSIAADVVKQDDTKSCIEIWQDDGSVKTEETDERLWHSLTEDSSEDVMDRAVVIWRHEFSAWRRIDRGHV